MLRVRVPSLETYRNATRPIILGSVRSIMNSLNVNQNILTFFNNEAEVSKLIGTDFTNKLRTGQNTDVGYENRQFVEVEFEDAEVNDGLDSSHRHLTNLPLWLDLTTEASISPLFVTKKINVTINRYFKDRVSAEQYRTRISSVLKNPTVNTFSTIIHYPVSYEIMECMEEIYDRLVKANVIDSTKVNSFEWFKNNCTVPHDIISNVIANNSCFVFKRSIEDMTLLFNGVDLAKTITKGKYYGQYLASIQYSFYYTEHTEYELRYPIMVYQQPISERWIPKINPQKLNDYPKYQFYEAMAAKEVKDYEKSLAPFYYAFPQEDNWTHSKIEWLDLKLQRLVSLEDKDEQVVLNLFKFGGEENFWNPLFKWYITKYCKKITKRHKNLLHLKLWSDEYPVEEDNIELMENGDLILKRKPTMSAIYRVCFYFDYALKYLEADAKEDIVNCEDEEYGRWILNVIIPEIPLPGDKEYCGNTPFGVCPWIDWDKDIDDKTDHGEDGGDPTIRPTHQLDFFLIAREEGDGYQYGRTNLLDYNATQYMKRK